MAGGWRVDKQITLIYSPFNLLQLQDDLISAPGSDHVIAPSSTLAADSGLPQRSRAPIHSFRQVQLCSLISSGGVIFSQCVPQTYQTQSTDAERMCVFAGTDRTCVTTCVRLLAEGVRKRGKSYQHWIECL